MLGEGDRVQVHFRVHASAGLPDLDFRELEREVVALTRTWDDELRDRLIARHGEGQGRALAAQWAPRFPRYYKASRSPELALHDIGCFVRLETLGEPFVVGLQNETDQTGERTRVGLYKSGGKVELAEAMPMLEDLGLRVIEEVPTRLKGGDGETWVQDFGVLGPGRPAARPRGATARAWPTASPRSGAATRSPTRSTGSCCRRGSTGARSRSCAPTASTASGSARASPRATRTTCWRRTRR